MSGNPNPVEVREALVRTGLAEFMLEEDTLPVHAQLVKDAARAWLDLFEECQECEGTGMDGSTYVPATHLTPSEVEPCPACNGLGVIPNREKVEAAAKAMWSNDEDWAADGPYPIAMHDAEAAIGAFLGLGER